MQHSVLRPADVKIDTAGLVAAHPVTFRLFTNETLIVLRIAKSQVVPTRASPLRHDVRFAPRFFGITNPIFRLRQRRLARSGGLVIFQRRRHDRALDFALRSVTAWFSVYRDLSS